MVTTLVENESSNFVSFKSNYGVSHILGPGGKVELGPAKYEAFVLSLPKAAGADVYPESASSEVNQEIMITNVGSQTLVFQPFPVLLPPVVIKQGQTEALFYVRYKLSIEPR